LLVISFPIIVMLSDCDDDDYNGCDGCDGGMDSPHDQSSIKYGTNTQTIYIYICPSTNPYLPNAS
jgi:hypothetical protein